jgi:hypothetical protein
MHMDPFHDRRLRAGNPIRRWDWDTSSQTFAGRDAASQVGSQPSSIQRTLLSSSENRTTRLAPAESIRARSGNAAVTMSSRIALELSMTSFKVRPRTVPQPSMTAKNPPSSR